MRTSRAFVLLIALAGFAACSGDPGLDTAPYPLVRLDTSSEAGLRDSYRAMTAGISPVEVARLDRDLALASAAARNLSGTADFDDVVFADFLAESFGEELRGDSPSDAQARTGALATLVGLDGLDAAAITARGDDLYAAAAATIRAEATQHVGLYESALDQLARARALRLGLIEDPTADVWNGEGVHIVRATVVEARPTETGLDLQIEIDTGAPLGTRFVPVRADIDVSSGDYTLHRLDVRPVGGDDADLARGLMLEVDAGEFRDAAGRSPEEGAGLSLDPATYGVRIVPDRLRAVGDAQLTNCENVERTYTTDLWTARDVLDRIARGEAELPDLPLYSQSWFSKTCYRELEPIWKADRR